MKLIGFYMCSDGGYGGDGVTDGGARGAGRLWWRGCEALGVVQVREV